MAARLGLVLYWTACALAAVVFLSLSIVGFGAADWSSTVVVFLFAAVAAGLIWAVGRAAFYILAGK